MAWMQHWTFVVYGAPAPCPWQAPNHTAIPTLPCVSFEVELLELVQTRDVALGVGVFVVYVLRWHTDLAHIVVRRGAQAEARCVGEACNPQVLGREIMVAAIGGMRAGKER